MRKNLEGQRHPRRDVETRRSPRIQNRQRCCTDLLPPRISVRCFPSLMSFSLVLTAYRQYCTATELLSEVATLVTEHVELNLIRLSELDERLFKLMQQWLLLHYQRDFHTSASRRRYLLALIARISSLQLQNQLKLHLLRAARRSSVVPTRTASAPCNGSVVMAWSEVLRESNSIERTHSPVCCSH